MKITKLLLAVAISATVGFVSCKPKDADVKTAIEAKIAASPELAGLTVDVKDGVATFSGELKDPAAKDKIADLTKDVKGVSSTTDNSTIALPPPPPVAAPASIETVLDEATQQKVKDGLKDLAGVTVEFAGDKAVLSGAVTKADRMKIMQMLAAAKVKSDVSKLTDK